MNLIDVKNSFAEKRGSTGSERHSIKSLSRRLMLSRQTVRKMLKSGELEFSAKFDSGTNGATYEFAAAQLDTIRESIVEEIIDEIIARLQGLDMDEHSQVLAALHGLRSHKADIEHEFSKPTDKDDDEDEHEVRKLIGGATGGAAGAAIGGRLLGNFTGGVAGAAIGSAAGRVIGGSDNADDIAAAGVGAGVGYGVNRAVKSAGGYRAVAKSAAPAARVVRQRMVDAIRRAAMRAAKVR